MYRTSPVRCIFFVHFFKKTAKKIHFIVFFVVIYLSHLMHRVSPVFIMSDSEYTPDLSDARGVTNPGAPILDRRGNFFATNCAPDVRTNVRENPHETARGHRGRRRSEAGEFAPLLPRGSRVDCGVSDSRRGAEAAAKARPGNCIFGCCFGCIARCFLSEPPSPL